MPTITTELLVKDLYLALDDRRTAEGLSWRAFATKLGLKESSVFSRLAAGQKNLSAENLHLIARYLGRSSDDFWRDVPDENHEQQGEINERHGSLREMSDDELASFDTAPA